MLTLPLTHIQPLLIEVRESDDIWLQKQENILWFHLLKKMQWEPLVPLAGQYYQALYDFNVVQAEKNSKAVDNLKPNPETQYEATIRLLEERPTESDEVCPVHPIFLEIKETPNVPEQIAPGVVPVRCRGRQPKCFFAMFKAFVGMSLMGKPSEPETVYQELQNNPAFSRTCGFTLPNKEHYRQSDIPTLRKLEQFDQIMTEAGLWSHAAVAQVKRNLESGKIVPERKLVHDTTHYKAFSSMHTVHKEETDGSVVKKSQSATTKNCRCPDRHNCPHAWVSADVGAGTVTKTGGQMHWAHKTSTLGLVEQSILIDAIAMTDAASHDSTSLVPQLARVFELYPELKSEAKIVLDDGAADDEGLKRQIEEEFDIKLLAPVNPRGRKALTTNLPKGIDHVTPSGTPVCGAGYPFNLLGVRTETDKFIFTAPNDENGHPVCHDCDQKDGCFRGEKGARNIEIPFEMLPWIDPEFPQSSIRFEN